jgi:regulator of protease activity HflC (stomatin/prohibitin superfamily)
MNNVYVGVGAVVFFVVFIVLPAAIKVLREYQRGVVFRLGRLSYLRGPGIRFIWPIIDKMIIVDTRVVTMDVPKQEMMTRDNVPVTVDAVIFFYIFDPDKAITAVENFAKASALFAQTTLRSVIGQSELDELLSERDKVNHKLQQIIDEHTEPWGIKVTAVEVRDVILPEGMKRSMANQAETERQRRAKVIHAEGEFQASQKLADAAQILGTQAAAIQLRFLQTLAEIATEQNSTIVFPVPIDLLEPFLKKPKQSLP